MKLFEKVMYPILIMFVAYFIYQARANLGYFENVLAAEGGILQWLTVATLLFASLMCIYRASLLKPFRGGLFSACCFLFGVIFLIFALEEMSWGQILFGYETPEFIRLRNSQGEMNIRHLVISGFEIADIIFTLAIKIIATLYFIVLPFFYSKLSQIKLYVNRFAIPLPRYTQTAAYVAGALLVSLIPSQLKYVVFEFVFYWILVLMMYNPLNDEVFCRKSLVR